MRPVLQRPLVQGFALFVVFTSGYFAGTCGWLQLPAAWAQGETSDKKQELPIGASEETVKKIQAAYKALEEAQTALQQEDLYKPATKGLNPTAVLSGGVDALSDLKSGRGVDPETFAALYSGDGVDEVAVKLERDSENRITYNNKPVRLYSVSRIQRLYLLRNAIAGVKAEDAATTPPAEPTEESEE